MREVKDTSLKGGKMKKYKFLIILFVIMLSGCSTNNTIAIFYAQTDRPDLTMEVIPIGKITSDLSIFSELKSSIEMIFTKVEE